MARITEEQRIMLDFINIAMSGQAKENDINEFRVNYVRFRMKYTRFNETNVNSAYTPNEKNEYELITDEKFPLTMTNPSFGMEKLNSNDESTRFKGAYEVIKEMNLNIENYLQTRDCNEYILSSNGHDLKDCVEYSKDYIAVEHSDEISEDVELNDTSIRSAAILSSDLTLNQMKDVLPLLKNQEKVNEYENIVRRENEEEIAKMEANYTDLGEENQVKLDNNIDEIIAKHPEILQKYKALLYEYNEDGTKKNLEELEQKRLETIQSIDEDLKITPATRKQKKSQLDVYYSDLYAKLLNKMIVEKEDAQKVENLINTVDGMNSEVKSNTQLLKDLQEEKDLTKNQLRKIEQTLKSIKETQDKQDLIQKRTEEYIKDIKEKPLPEFEDKETSSNTDILEPKEEKSDNSKNKDENEKYKNQSEHYNEDTSKDVNINVNVNIKPQEKEHIDYHREIEDETPNIAINQDEKKQRNVIENNGKVEIEEVAENLQSEEEISNNLNATEENPKVQQVADSREDEFVEIVIQEIANNEQLTSKLIEKHVNHKIEDLRLRYRAGEISKRDFDNKFIDLASLCTDKGIYKDEALYSKELDRVIKEKYQYYKNLSPEGNQEELKQKKSKLHELYLQVESKEELISKIKTDEEKLIKVEDEMKSQNKEDMECK